MAITLIRLSASLPRSLAPAPTRSSPLTRKARLDLATFHLPFFATLRKAAGFSGMKSICAPLPCGKPEKAIRLMPALWSSSSARAPCPARFGTIILKYSTRFTLAIASPPLRGRSGSCAAGWLAGDYTARVEGHSRLGEQPGTRLAAGLRAMTHPVFLLGTQLGEGLAERRVEKERVVAEAPRPARSIEQDAFYHALDHRLEPAPRAHDGDQAAESRAPSLDRHPRHLVQHDLAALGIAQAVPAIARREHAGAAAQRIHLDPGIVGQGHLARSPRDPARLPERIVGVREFAFGWERDVREVGEVHDTERDAFEERGHFARLGAIGRGENEGPIRGRRRPRPARRRRAAEARPDARSPAPPARAWY